MPLALLLACSPPEASRGRPVQVRFPGDVIRVGHDGQDHHATLTQAGAGVLLAHSWDTQIVIEWLRPSLTRHFSTVIGGAHHHPQTSRLPNRQDAGVVVAVATPDAGPIVGQIAGRGGLEGAPRVIYGGSDGEYVDVTPFGDGLVAVWAQGPALGGARLSADLAEVAALTPLASGGPVDPPTVRAGLDRAFAGWSPLRGDARTVEIAPLDATLTWGPSVEIDRAPPGVGSPRVSLAPHPDGTLPVAWRWSGPASEPGDPEVLGAFAVRLDADLRPLGPRHDVPDATRPVVAAVGDCAAVVWEVDATLLLQVFGAAGEPLTDAVPVPADTIAERPYLDVGPDGAGLLTWETWSDSGAYDVGMRRVIIDGC